MTAQILANGDWVEVPMRIWHEGQWVLLSSEPPVIDPEPEPLLFDDFERADGTGLGDTPFTYVTDDGWVIQDGTAVMTSTTSTATFALGQVPGTIDYSVRAEMLPTQAQVYTFLVARYADAQGWDNVLRAGRDWSGSAWRSCIYARIGGVENLVAQGSIGAIDVPSVWEFVVEGNLASLWQDGVEVISPTELPAGSPTGSRAGLSTYNNNGFAEWGVYPLD